ncbi:hypothetical protein [Blastococcus goldschmidtiae]|uniref:Secreted protein n=1 Tax=Blastococcus goldschmidtiae TaxID=3075546 RepID=A0ABU2K8B7_9ACTN|nr:hypothetical protein [Blastococcus sp. DSM 46792]MDT0276421.1 hypothetical protein [Blastococcus sp. DSM 46792]
MVRRALRIRPAAVLLIGLAGCGNGPPQVCSLVMLESSVAADLSGLDVDLRSVDAVLCVEDDCAAPDPWSGDAPPGDTVRRVGPDIPRGDEVQVRIVLTDSGTGAEVYRGSGAVPVEVVEPNGPGCGETPVLPTVTADPDGTLRS